MDRRLNAKSFGGVPNSIHVRPRLLAHSLVDGPVGLLALCATIPGRVASAALAHWFVGRAICGTAQHANIAAHLHVLPGALLVVGVEHLQPPFSHQLFPCAHALCKRLFQYSDHLRALAGHHAVEVGAPDIATVVEDVDDGMKVCCSAHLSNAAAEALINDLHGGVRAE
eukprot:1225045-Prymnesium_polylepis.1